MGKASRKDRLKRVRVDDAARLMELVARLTSQRSRDPGDAWIVDVAGRILAEWDRERIVVRLDSTLAGALLDSNQDSVIGSSWLDRFPFGSIAVALSEPVTIVDDGRPCTYHGFLVTGTKTHRQLPPGVAKRPGAVMPPDTAAPSELVWTTYGPISEALGVRALWLFTEPDDPLPGGQSLSLQLRVGPAGSAIDAFHADATVADVVSSSMAQYRAIGRSEGVDVATLMPLTVLTLLYLSATEPDLDELVPETIVRPQQLMGARVLQAGWRVGAALRAMATPTASVSSAHSVTRWRLPAHIRAAHFHRFRIATRDESGAIIGNVRGEQGRDWHYELRWIPPTPVNVRDAGPQPVVRDVS